ncbi:tetratricopeptide repeat protein [Magnetospirillum sulfuroxidans]|uniref:Glycosyltransferase family protein n=1 Tax=Magnetospirillum sulfuroxidans TaxID=611300 RepID=A0ABS5IAM3_9PROT|nr:tetratricopeptide repeat-containing glycosyltransferase family protein [Magnetospirillum sulfuroxidans]MBR9971217.1 glycosyltransferase family protein [Magnetospirillum sulfuroxidans]
MNRGNKPISAAEALANGTVAWSEGKIDQACQGFASAALLAPAAVLAHVNLGVALRRQGHVAAAITSHRRALALTPDDPVAHSNLGNALREIGKLAEAERHLRRAVAAQPDNLSFRYNLALLLRDSRHYDESHAMMTALVTAQPQNGDYAWDLALSDLYGCDYAKGFAGYEARWKLARSPKRDFITPQASPGQDLRGKTVLVAAEQGFGDSLQFARFLPILAAQCGTLVVECLPELQTLFAAIPGVALVFAKGAPSPAHDLWIPIMSLAHWLGVGADSLPGPVPYLRAPQSLAKPLGRPPGSLLNVGLIWAGKTVPRDRSWPLEQLLPLMEDPRLAFWSLQMGERAGDMKALGVNALVRDLSPAISSFADTAALMNALDIIVTIDTSAAHLAGALGKPTWMLLRYVSDWRWLDQGDTCAWYPSMRLFRQPDPEDFSTPVARLKSWLTQAADKVAAAPPVG